MTTTLRPTQKTRKKVKGTLTVENALKLDARSQIKQALQDIAKGMYSF